jgi:hypothetical protein
VHSEFGETRDGVRDGKGARGFAGLFDALLFLCAGGAEMTSYDLLLALFILTLFVQSAIWLFKRFR